MIGYAPFQSNTVATDLRPAAALVEVARSIDRQSSVSIEPDRPFYRYLDELQQQGVSSAVQIRTVKKVWSLIRAKLGDDASLPLSQPTGRGTVQLAWYSNRFTVEVEVDAAGQLEWFYRDQTTNTLDGTDDETVATLPKQFYDRLRDTVR
jgi:hypothetical protein